MANCSRLSLLLLLAATAGAETRLSGSIIAVGIAHKVRTLQLQPEGQFSVIDQSTGEMKRLETGRRYKVEADGGTRIILGPFLFSGPVRLLPGKPGEHVLVGERKYLGNILFRPNKDDTVTAIDEVGLEEYLCGVLPKEMSPDWPLEALKAQAVVARTFALNNLGRFSKSGYDLSDGMLSQVYGGLEIESERVKQAVAETSGQVLRWQGKLMPTYFHASSGGRTADPTEVWSPRGSTPKPLRGVHDRYDKDSPHADWSAYFRNYDILEAMSRHGIQGAVISNVRYGQRTSSGRLKDVRLRIDGDWVRVSTTDLRLWLGAQELKSTMIHVVKRRKNGIEFFGSGYGHGVGLSQWGARVQAEKGRDYRQILEYYFPGASLGTHDG